MKKPSAYAGVFSFRAAALSPTALRLRLAPYGQIPPRFRARVFAFGSNLRVKSISRPAKNRDQGDEVGCQLTTLDQSDVPPSFVATM